MRKTRAGAPGRRPGRAYVPEPRTNIPRPRCRQIVAPVRRRSAPRRYVSRRTAITATARPPSSSPLTYGSDEPYNPAVICLPRGISTWHCWYYFIFFVFFRSFFFFFPDHRRSLFDAAAVVVDNLSSIITNNYIVPATINDYIDDINELSQYCSVHGHAPPSVIEFLLIFLLIMYFCFLVRKRNFHRPRACLKRICTYVSRIASLGVRRFHAGLRLWAQKENNYKIFDIRCPIFSYKLFFFRISWWWRATKALDNDGKSF